MQPISFREATEADLPAIVAMLADDPLGKTREVGGKTRETPAEKTTAPAPAYSAAFRDIAGDANNQLIVAATDDGTPEIPEIPEIIVGVLQLTFIPSLTYSGGMRAQIEGVRVHTNFRGSGVGRELMLHATALAKTKGCVLLQLTTDKARPDALRFYEGLGFTASHWGMKLRL